MTLEERIKQEKDIKILKGMFLKYHRETLGFDRFLAEKLGEEYRKLSVEYAKVRVKFELEQSLKKYKA